MASDVTREIARLLGGDPICNGRVTMGTVMTIAALVGQGTGRWAGVSELVEAITKDEGATVTFTGPNPDFNGLPNEAVTVQQGPGWSEEIYRGDSLADCLRRALAHRESESVP